MSKPCSFLNPFCLLRGMMDKLTHGHQMWTTIVWRGIKIRNFPMHKKFATMPPVHHLTLIMMMTLTEMMTPLVTAMGMMWMSLSNLTIFRIHYIFHNRSDCPLNNLVSKETPSWILIPFFHTLWKVGNPVLFLVMAIFPRSCCSIYPQRSYDALWQHGRYASKNRNPLK